MTKSEFLRLVGIGFVGLILAACAPIITAQETQPAVNQTMVASETEVVSPTPEASATPENTPTNTATATPEPSPSPKPIEFPYNIKGYS